MCVKRKWKASGETPCLRGSKASMRNHTPPSQISPLLSAISHHCGSGGSTRKRLWGIFLAIHFHPSIGKSFSRCAWMCWAPRHLSSVNTRLQETASFNTRLALLGVKHMTKYFSTSPIFDDWRVGGLRVIERQVVIYALSGCIRNRKKNCDSL